MAVGQRISMIDGYARVTGSIDYALNFELPGMLHARILRSPYPHARVVRVDTEKAERLSGVAAVFSRNDLIGQDHIDPYYGSLIRDESPVALDKVRFVGNPVAAVAAADDDAAMEALGLIDVEYKELPAIFDPEEALAPGAPLVHEGPRRLLLPDFQLRSPEGTNQINHFKQRKGDIERGFREADLIFENTFSSPAAQHVAMEPHVVVAQVQDRRITVWTSCQGPYVVQGQLARIFKVPQSNVRVIVFNIGGGFGGRNGPKVEPLAALLAWKSHRPVRLVLRREEDFCVATQHAGKVKLKTGVKRDGTLVAVQATCYYNSGPIADATPSLISRGYAAAGPYRVPHLWVDSYGVYTNVMPSAAFRGFGITQVAWAHECQMDIIADALNMDPLELRLKNALQKGDPFSTSEPMGEMHYTELLKGAAESIGWGEGPLVVREGNKVRAKGITAIIKGMRTPTTSVSTVKLNSDGSLNVLTSTVEMGQGAKTVLAQIAADEMGLAVDRVHVSNPDTAFTPFDMLTSASRSTYCMGSAIRLAVRDIKGQLLEAAAERLEASKEDLVIQAGRIMVRGSPERSFSYSDVMRRTGYGTLVGRGTFVSTAGPGGGGLEFGLDFENGQGYGSAQWHPAVVACEVEVDLETGRVEVTRLHSELYAGKVINPKLCELQVQGAAIFGLGQALFEEIVLDTDGRTTNANLSDYMIPSFEDLPRQMTAHLLEPEGVTEVHGIGETNLPPVRPAIANAVCRAIGNRIFDLPITPEKVLAAVRKTNPRPGPGA